MTYVPGADTDKKAAKRRLLVEDADTQMLLTRVIALLEEIRDHLKYGD